ncbi:FxSxx-COOH system tetratricopeptide repeat protein, partial [Kitasatospora cineracea]|uniref:FxSxx-COOH system tetratricopeptide repeat protein n=1 Tax=Kitasatospora cineracea TaxID=88074 RepID=UPI0033F8AA58
MTFLWKKQAPPRDDEAADTGRPEAGAGLQGSTGAIVATGDVSNSSTYSVQAEHAVVLPPEAFMPIPADAAAGGVSNILSELFVGRIDELALLDGAFAREGEVVVYTVHGLGGIGKSALAAHWAARREEKLRWQITADTPAALRAGLAELARTLKPVLAGLPEEQQAQRAVDWLSGNRGWLLVLDNVEDPAHIAPLLKRVPRRRILITTRLASGWHRHATTIRLGVLEAADSVDLFLRILPLDGPRESDGAAAVCEEVGHLALAVEQAAAYCAQSGITPTAYLGMLTSSPAGMLAAGSEGTASDRTVARIWRLTLDRLADTPLAGEVLRILAWYAPDHIPRYLLAPLATEPEVTGAVGRLLAYNMVTANPDGTLTVHRLVQTLARTPDPDDPHRRQQDIDQARDQATYLLANALPPASAPPENWPRYRELLPHSDTLTSRHTPDHDTTHTAYVLNCTATFRQQQGTPAAAIPAFQRALVANERIFGPDHPDTLSIRNNLANTYKVAGVLDRAITLFESTLTDSERVLGPDHPSTLSIRNNLAGSYAAAGVLDRAITLFERTLTDSERVLGPDHPSTLSARNNLAYTYEAAGVLDRAIALFERTLTDSERVLGPDHPSTLLSRNNLAGTYQAAGDLDRATTLHERALADSERVLGPDHPNTLSARNNLAGAYQAAGDLARAITLFERTLAACERVLGPDHPDTLLSRNNLAGTYQAAGDLDRATTLHESTLADSERVLGPDHPNTLSARNNLAHAYQAAGGLDRATTLFERTLADSERVFGPDHPDTLLSRNNLAG